MIDSGTMGTEYAFDDWCACPECGERERVSTLAYGTDVVFECYDCGLVSEFDIGGDSTLQSLDGDAIEHSGDENR